MGNVYEADKEVGNVDDVGIAPESGPTAQSSGEPTAHFDREQEPKNLRTTCKLRNQVSYTTFTGQTYQGGHPMNY